jgi:toxin ParE1/3/4
VKVKPIDIRRLAKQDLQDAIDHYRDQASSSTALRFLAAVERAMDSIARSPGSGSPSLAELLDVPGLRYRTLKQFPYMVLYQEGPTEISILRVLHQRRDLGTFLFDAE